MEVDGKEFLLSNGVNILMKVFQFRGPTKDSLPQVSFEDLHFRGRASEGARLDDGCGGRLGGGEPQNSQYEKNGHKLIWGLIIYHK